MMHLVGTHPIIPQTVHGIFAQTLQMIVVAGRRAHRGYVQMRRGFSPIAQLRARLADVQQGRERQLRGDYPTEVQPLVTDLNALLAARDASVSRAQAKAGDLAHGLKTPLAVLMQEADHARASGHHAMADTLTGELDRMRRQIDYHLAQARAGASAATAGTRADVALVPSPRCCGPWRVSTRIAGYQSWRIPSTVHARVEAAGSRGNARKPARQCLQSGARPRYKLPPVCVRALSVITVDDDGRGWNPAMRNAVLSRGVRADESAPGSGLGLAIVRELAVLLRRHESR
jgi:signal transduction histidine kinase